MSVEVAQAVAPARSGFQMPMILRLALRDLRGGLSGFYVFVACVALGVAVITAVGALGDGLRLGLDRQGELLLGGDVRLSRSHRKADQTERAWMAQRARVAEMATMRAIARRSDGKEQLLVEIKAVDGAYPLVGQVTLKGDVGLTTAIRESAQPGAAVDPILLERLKLAVGDSLSLGNATIPIRAVIKEEPDRLSNRLTFGPRVLISQATLATTGLAKPGSLVRWRYSLSFKGKSDDAIAVADFKAFRARLKADLAQSGFMIKDRRNPAPRVARTLERLRQFLTLIGLTALLVGGVGVANAVATFIDRRRKVIAVFKSVGARGSTIFGIYLIEVMLIAGSGVLIGLAVGALLPLLLNDVLGELLPLKMEFAVSARSLATAASYGFLVAFVFILWPLGRAELVRPGVLFREQVAPERVWPRWWVMALSALSVAALAGFAIFTSDSRAIAVYFVVGLSLLFAVFLGLGTAVTWLARKLPRSKRPELALAISNIGAPGGLTRAVVLSLGSGLTLLVAVALADASLVAELTGRLPTTSPSYFVLDIPLNERAAFAKVVQRTAPEARIIEAPMLRGRLVTLKGRPTDEIKAPPSAQWVLNGDRGLSYATEVPEGSKVVAGTWWPADYDGEPLVSFEVEIARDLGLAIGDRVTVNVLGRNLTAKIANLREVKWESLALNFVMVFSPNALSAAPHSLLATLTLPGDATLAREAALAQAITKAFPTVTTIRVRDAINAFNAIFARVMMAVRVAGGVTLLAGALVLAGALATAQRRRLQLAAVLKALGATRRKILSSHLIEYLLLGSVTALIAVALGTLAAWVTLTEVMDVEFIFSLRAVVEALVLSLGLVLIFGGYGTWRTLQAPAVPYLRSE